MAGRVFLLVAALLFVGCGSPPPPSWIAAGHQQLETFKRDFLTGAAPLVTELHFKKAVEEVKKAGDVDRLGKVWLTRMALQAAALEPLDDAEYRRVETAGPVPTNHHYYLFLKGELASVDASQLAESYRFVLTALRGRDTALVIHEIERIDDPLSRLIAAAVMLRDHPQNEALLHIAVETASTNGWKRVLLAWLKRQGAFYAASGETAKAEAIGRRMDLMSP
jgi:hypothetical protein